MNPEATPAGVVPAEAAALPHLSNGQLFAISAMSFALSALWGALLTLIVPTPGGGPAAAQRPERAAGDRPEDGLSGRGGRRRRADGPDRAAAGRAR